MLCCIRHYNYKFVSIFKLFFYSGVRSFVVEVSIGCDAEIGLVCRSLRARLVAYNSDTIIMLFFILLTLYPAKYIVQTLRRTVR